MPSSPADALGVQEQRIWRPHREEGRRRRAGAPSPPSPPACVPTASHGRPPSSANPARPHLSAPPQVLTAAHVVANSTYMEIQLPGSPDKTPARVVSVAHETDLALIEVDSGFEGVEPLALASPADLPQLRDKVYVLGFPVGGNDLSITEGVVSRVEARLTSHHAPSPSLAADLAPAT